MASRIVKYKCPYCEARMEKSNLINHIDLVHNDLIPEGYTAFRIVFDYINKKPAGYNGKCTECSGPTGWNEAVGRYNRQCSSPKCKESYLRKFEKNMNDKLGVTRISSTVEGQEKMLSNRRISGKYKFQDGVEKSYVGSYEKNTLEFLDKVMNCNSSDIITPGPAIQYKYLNKDHFYISDMYYQPYNLIIEVKDGGDNPNKRVMEDYRAKQIEKEKAIIKNTDYNYIRLTNNNLSQLLSVFADLKMQMKENTGKRVINVNESMNALLSGYIPGVKDTGSTYIVNYTKNNVFSGELESGYGISDSPRLINFICRDKEGKLNKAPEDFLKNAKYNVYLTKRSIKEVSELLSPYIGQFVEEGFIYETITGKKLYSYDQFGLDECTEEIVDYYKSLEVLGELSNNLIISDNDIFNDKIKIDDDNITTVFESLSDNNLYIIKSNKYSDLFLKTNKEEYKNNRLIFEYLLTEEK